MAAGDSAAATAHLAAMNACRAALYRPRRIRSSGASIADPTYAAALTATNAAVTATASGSATYATIPFRIAVINKVKLLYGPVTINNNVRRRYMRVAMNEHRRLVFLHQTAP